MRIFVFKFEDELIFIHNELIKQAGKIAFKVAILFLIIYAAFYISSKSVVFRATTGVYFFCLLVGRFYLWEIYSYASKRNRIIDFIDRLEDGAIEITTLPASFIFIFAPRKTRWSLITELKEVPDFEFTKRENISVFPQELGIGRCFRITDNDEPYYLIFGKEATEQEIQNQLDSLTKGLLTSKT